jgi:hypothetical protein
VLTAQTNLYSAQQALVSARMSRLITLVNLYRDLGGGWIEHTGDTPAAARTSVARTTQQCAVGSPELGFDRHAMSGNPRIVAFRRKRRPPVQRRADELARYACNMRPLQRVPGGW